jgi:hypothetical protein
LDSSQDYSEENTVIAVKIQFLAIEIARNRDGHNAALRSNFKPKPRKPRQQAAPAQEVTRGGVNMSEVEMELQQVLTGSHPMLQS